MQGPVTINTVEDSNLHYSTDQSFHWVSKIFILSFENGAKRNKKKAGSSKS